MTTHHFEVRGKPAPQGSKRAFAIRRGGVPTGKIAVIESSHDRVKSWRQAVIESTCWNEPPLEGPLSVTMVFLMQRPKGHYRTGRNAGQLRDSAPTAPAGTPDLSKLTRATEDALTDAGIWRDDAQVTEYGHLAKIYAGPGTYPWTGALITVRQMTP